ncbi:MAG: branched-chain amino acid ABC transporter permease [bacterium]|nr:branched-chain amino acid ABC transporter permease [bacterium]MDE0288968.1 branched-chain amino acid ABC transporter permease [bacterium]MDE0376860.1 branched-chain amino acid ABC transporter permease [bacterium]
MRGRPLLHTSYARDQAMMPTATKKAVLAVFLGLAALAPFASRIPLYPDFLGDNDWMKLLSHVAIFGIGALGINLLTGVAGQVSLGHAFFMGVGAYVGAVFGAPTGDLWGLGLPMWIWLPMAGVVPALIGILVGPAAVRVRGLYLAFATLALVFIGEWAWRNLTFITGGSFSGRSFPDFQWRWWKEEEPVVDFTTDSVWMGYAVSEEAKVYLMMVAFLVVATLLAKNLQRTRTGRAFQAIRDRDIAAEVMGVNEFRYKLMAFGISSGFAGVAGALFASFVGRQIPETWDLFLSVEFLAIILIGGAGTVSGALMGSAFVVILPRLVQDFTDALKQTIVGGEGTLAAVADVVVAVSADDSGIVHTLPGVGPGLSVFQLNQILFGLLIILFMILEPLGLYGIWVRVRNYWRGWPFTY